MRVVFCVFRVRADIRVLLDPSCDQLTVLFSDSLVQEERRRPHNWVPIERRDLVARPYVEAVSLRKTDYVRFRTVLGKHRPSTLKQGDER